MAPIFLSSPKDSSRKTMRNSSDGLGSSSTRQPIQRQQTSSSLTISLRSVLIERRLGCSINEVEYLIRRAKTTEPSRALFQELQETEKKLTNWLSSLATKELTKNYKASDADTQWVKRISRFFHAYVGFLQRFFEDGETTRRSPVNIFVSHSGSEKDSYVIPLANYLKKNNVDGVFVDKQDILHGSYSNETMLHAAVSCQTFWCVLSENFLARKWPMCELMIAYVRHLTELNGRGFCLFIDCFEAQIGHGQSTWLDRILKMETLRPCDENEYERPMPGNMEPMRWHESFDERIERLAGTVMVNGCPILPRSCLRQPSLDDQYVLQHNRFPTSSFVQAVSTARHIRFLNTWIPNLPAFTSSLIQALKRGSTVQFLLLDKNSRYRDARSKALRTSGQPMMKDPVRMGIRGNLEMIDVIYAAAFGDEQVGRERVQIRFFDSLPSISIFQADSKIFTGKFLHDKLSIESTVLETTAEELLGEEAIAEFDILWECARPPVTTANGAFMKLKQFLVKCLRWFSHLCSRCFSNA